MLKTPQLNNMKKMNMNILVTWSKLRLLEEQSLHELRLLSMN
jgi:hypothetical protein